MIYLFNENCKSVKKEMEEDARRWKDFHVHGATEKIFINAYITEVMYRLNAISITIVTTSFTEI
jgi:hypothetical protein